MDVRNWPIGHIMQLPDHCFGQRFPVGVELIVGGGVTEWDMSEMCLPEKFVLWYVSIYWQAWSASSGSTLRLALGDQLPTTTGMMDKLEPLLHGIGDQGMEPRVLRSYQYTGHEGFPLRKLYPSMGRHLIGEVVSAGGATSHVRVILTVSSLPTEVPDCILGLGKSL